MGLGSFFKNIFSGGGGSDKMDLQRVKNNLVSSLKSTFGLEFEGKLESSDDGSKYVKVTNSITHNAYNDDIFCKILVFPSGSFGIEFVFDKLRVTPNVVQMLYEFNENISFLSAYVRDDGYLVVHYNVAYLDEGDIWENVRRALNSLSNDTIKRYLVPLSNLTYSE